MAHNGGLLQVNVDFPESHTTFWHLNTLRMSYCFYAFDGADVPNENWPLYLDTDGYPQQMPGGTATMWYMPQVWVYGEVGDTWDLFFPSDKCTASFASNGEGGFAVSSAEIVPGQIRYTITAIPAETATGRPYYIGNLRITAMSAPILPGELSLHRTEYQSLIDAGEWFDPRFLALLGYGERGFGKVRCMNWQNTNNSLERSAANRRTVTNLSWVRSSLDKDHWAGTCSKTLNAFTTSTRIPTLPTEWVDGQVIQFRATEVPTSLLSNNITRGTTTTIQFTTNHGLTSGDKISFYTTFNSYPSGWWSAVEEPQASTGLPPDFTVTVTADDTVTIPLNSSGFAALSSARFWPVITLTDGTLPAKRMYSGLNVQNLATQSWTSNIAVTAIYNSAFDCLIFKTDFVLSGVFAGVPIEAVTRLANKLNAHPHYCFPTMANSGYKQTVAATVFTGTYELNDGLDAYFEQDNEAWNGSFSAWYYNKALGATQAGGAANTIYGYGQKVMAMKSDIAAVFGTSKPYKLVFGFQNNAGGGYDTWLQGNPLLHSDNPALYPGNNVDSFEFAPYYQTKFNYSSSAADYTDYKTNLNLWLTGTDANKATAFDWFALELISGPSEPGNTSNIQIDENINTIIPAHIAGIAGYTGRQGLGLELQTYEGGIHTVGPDSIAGGFPADDITVQNVRDFYFEFLESHQFAFVMAYYFKNLLRLGVKYPSQFTVAAPWGYTHLWGAQRVNSYPATTTRQYTALRRINDGYTIFRGSA